MLFGLFMIVFALAWLLIPLSAIGIGNFVILIISIIDITKREWPDKTTWLLIVLLAPFGSLIYFFNERKKLDAKGYVIAVRNMPSQNQPSSTHGADSRHKSK